jgi:uncharacterized membrane protein (DUF4010 family)
MTAAGVGFALLMARPASPDAGAPSVAVRNPFRLMPALKFGAIFGAILFAGKAASAAFGSGAIYWTSMLGGSLDVDAVSLSLAELLGERAIAVPVAVIGVLLALLANAVIKAAIAAYAGDRTFARQVAAGFVAMFATGFPLWFLTRGL